jgi:ankyrin repeat protein
MNAGSRSDITAAVLVLTLMSGSAAASDLRLIEAVKNHKLETARSLIQQRVDVNSNESDGTTALHWAAHWDDVDAADFLIRAGANVNAATDLGVTPISLACLNGSGTLVQKLLAAGGNAEVAGPNGETALMTCARAGSLQAVTALLAHGANANAKENSHDQTALMWAVAEQHPDVVQALIEHGADVHARSRTHRQYVVRKMPGSAEKAGQNSGVWIERGGSTPLFFAARTGDIDSARMLLDAGADVNETAPDGNNALLIAAQSSHGEFGAFLLDRGADPNAADIGYAALHSAVLRCDLKLAKALLAHGANPNVRLIDGAPIRRTDSDSLLPGELAGATPFLLAARFLDKDLMLLLAASKADPLIPMDDGTTPLMAAAGVGWVSTLQRRGGYVGLGAGLPTDEQEAFEAVKLAIDLGSKVTDVNQDRETALHGAVSKGYTSVIELLANAKAHLNSRDRHGRTPLAVARSLAPADVSRRIVDLLLKLGAKE